MRIGRHSGAIILAVAILTGCNPSSDGEQQSGPTPSPTAAPEQQAVRKLPEEQQRSLAFDAAFGGNAVVESDGEQRRYTPGRLIWIGERAVLLSPGDNLSDCHACTGAVAIHYLEPAGSGFRLVDSWPGLIKGWGWGKAPEWTLSEAFADYPVVVIEGGYTGQGITCGGVSLTELRPDGPVQSELVKTTFSDQSGLGGKTEGAEIDGKIVNIRKNTSFDVAYSGTQTFTESWVRRGDRFVPRDGQSKLPC